MLRLRSFLVLVLLTAPGLGTAQDEGLLHLGYLTLAFPALWKFDFAQRPIVGHGPSGETVLITVRTRKDEEPADAARGVRDAVTDFVKGSMVEIATQHGMKLDRPISPVEAPANHVAFSAVSSAKGIFGNKEYFVQYVLGGKRALIYITFEGKGDTEAAAQRFDAVISTQKWSDGV